MIAALPRFKRSSEILYRENRERVVAAPQSHVLQQTGLTPLRQLRADEGEVDLRDYGDRGIRPGVNGDARRPLDLMDFRFIDFAYCAGPTLAARIAVRRVAVTLPHTRTHTETHTDD